MGAIDIVKRAPAAGEARHEQDRGAAETEDGKEGERHQDLAVGAAQRAALRRAELTQGDPVADRLVFRLEAGDVILEHLEGGVRQGDRALRGRRLRADREDRHTFLGGEDEAVDRAFLEQFAGSFARGLIFVAALAGFRAERALGGDRRGRDSNLSGDLAPRLEAAQVLAVDLRPGRERVEGFGRAAGYKGRLRGVDEDLTRGRGDLQGPFVQAGRRDADLVGREDRGEDGEHEDDCHQSFALPEMSDRVYECHWPMNG